MFNNFHLHISKIRRLLWISFLNFNLNLQDILFPVGKYWSPGRPLKIPFDRDVRSGRPRDVPIWRPEMTSRGRLNLTFKGRPWKVDSGRPLEGLESTQTWMSKTFLSDLIRLTKYKSISTLKVYWQLSKTSKMEHFLQN